MGCLSLVSLLLVFCTTGMADEYTNEDPPLYFVDDIPEDAAPPLVAEEEKPLVFPEAMQKSTQIIVQFSSDLGEIGTADINWTAFYAGFPELNLSENITMPRA
jgi:hypothetical protein